MNRPIESEADLLGYQALVQLENYPALHVVPILILGSGLAESDVPTRLNYDLFLTIADELELYLPKVRELGSRQKSRRKISRYVCPKCEGRLTFTSKEEDLFCPRCGTGVAIIEPGGSCTYASPGGINQPCKVEDLIPPKVEL